MRSWQQLKELQKLGVIQPEEAASNNNEKTKKDNKAIPVSNNKYNLPKSIVPGTKTLRDPLSSAFILEKNFKIMTSLF